MLAVANASFVYTTNDDIHAASRVYSQNAYDCLLFTTHTASRVYDWPYAAARWQLIKNAFNSQSIRLTLTLTINANPYPNTNPKPNLNINCN